MYHLWQMPAIAYYMEDVNLARSWALGHVKYS